MNIHEIFRPEDLSDDSWESKLEAIFEGSDIVEIEKDGRGAMLARIDKNKSPDVYNDWWIELQNPDTSQVRTEKYYFKNGVGLIIASVSGFFGTLPNAAGLAFNESRGTMGDRADFFLGLSEGGMTEEEKRSRADRIVNTVKDMTINSKFFLRNGVQVRQVT